MTIFTFDSYFLRIRIQYYLVPFIYPGYSFLSLNKKLKINMLDQVSVRIWAVVFIPNNESMSHIIFPLSSLLTRCNYMKYATSSKPKRLKVISCLPAGPLSPIASRCYTYTLIHELLCPFMITLITKIGDDWPLWDMLLMLASIFFIFLFFWKNFQ